MEDTKNLLGWPLKDEHVLDRLGWKGSYSKLREQREKIWSTQCAHREVGVGWK